MAIDASPLSSTRIDYLCFTYTIYVFVDQKYIKYRQSYEGSKITSPYRLVLSKYRYRSMAIDASPLSSTQIDYLCLTYTIYGFLDQKYIKDRQSYEGFNAYFIIYVSNNDRNAAAQWLLAQIDFSQCHSIYHA